MSKQKKRGFILSQLGYRHWIGAVADEMRRLVNGSSRHGLRRAVGVRRRADSLVRCITRAVGHVCRCNAPMEGSGRMEGGSPCHARSCPRCGRRRQAAALEWFSECFKHVETRPQHQDHSWKLLTLTTQYDPYDQDDLTVEQLETRAKGVRASFRAVWKMVKDADAGAWTSVEMAEYGEVHLHAMLYCRFIHSGVDGDSDELYPAMIRGWSGIGKIRKIIEIPTPESGALEVTKYALKTPGAAHASWFAASADYGIPRPLVVNPDLAARWEVATWGLQLQNRYGVFRKFEPVEDDAPKEAPGDRLGEHCPHCGLVGDWFEKELPVGEWSLLCYNHHVRPFGRPVRGNPDDEENDTRETRPGLVAAGENERQTEFFYDKVS